MRLVLAAFLGGVLGTSLRLAAEFAWPPATDRFPSTTLLVNVVGSLALGWLAGGLWTRPSVPTWVRVALGPGVLGSFTTFSGVVVALIAEGSTGLWATAAIHLAATVALGLGAAALGLRLGAHFENRRARLRDPRRDPRRDPGCG